MGVGSDLIGMVQTNTKGFCKENVEKFTKYWPGSSYLVLRSKPIVPGGRLLIYIGCKYNVWKFLYFIVTENVGRSTQAGLPYLSKYLGQFYNVSICPGALVIVIYKFFGYANEVDPHKTSRQSDLVLEKFWVTQCGWIRLYTTVAMVITITNSWKLFHYGHGTSQDAPFFYI